MRQIEETDRRQDKWDPEHNEIMRERERLGEDGERGMKAGGELMSAVHCFTFLE